MCSEGQVTRLYKYNGLSPRMFHTAWHFHYLKHTTALLTTSNLPQICMWLNATHELYYEQASNDINAKTDGGGGGWVCEKVFMNGRNEVFLCAACHLTNWDISDRRYWTLQVK